MDVGFPIGAAPPPEFNEYPSPDAIEISTPVDEDSWRYSRFALPFLLWCLLCLLTLFCLTFWQQCGDIKKLQDGVPRLVQLDVIVNSSLEAGQPKPLKAIRIASGWFGFFGVIIALIVFFIRPKYTLRAPINYICCILLLICCALAWIAFGVGMANYNYQAQCPFNRRFTGQKCIAHKAYAITNSAEDAGMGTFSLIALLLLAYNTKTNHWKLSPREWEEAQEDTTEPTKERLPGEMVQRNVTMVRKWLTGLALLATLICIVADMVFVVLLHEDREKGQLYAGGVDSNGNPLGRGRTDASFQYASTVPFEHPGWKTINTRLRYSTVGFGIITVLLNFLPFRSKTIAYGFGFLYFSTAVMAMCAFGFDVYNLGKAKNLGRCPNAPDGMGQTCSQGSFIATCVFDIFVSIFLFAYVIIEYIYLQYRQCQHCDRAFTMEQLIKHETNECPRRPVRCEVCAKTMTSQLFEQHKSYCTYDHVKCKHCGTLLTKWNVKSHQEECSHWPVACTMCGENFQRVDMPHHVMVCPNRPTSCDTCGETFRSRDIEAHRTICGEVLVQCELCEENMQRYRVIQHQQNECPKRLVECELCVKLVPKFHFQRH